MTFEAAERVADAVLYEGYVLYPYRASAIKNKFRWQFGVVAPKSPHEDAEPNFTQTECLIEPTAPTPRLSIRVRFLRPQPVVGDGDSASSSWLEAAAHAFDFGPIDLVSSRKVQLPLRVAGVDAQVTLYVRPVGRFLKLQLRVESLEPWRPDFDSSRDAMLERSLVGTHVLLGLENGVFVSMLAPTEDAASLVADCQNRHTWPVLIGDSARRNLMLSSPILLFDFPSVAWESADFFNPPETPPPETAFVMVDGRRITKGTHVRLQPNRHTDAMDTFLTDQAATVAGVYRDVDERVYVAVTIDADPAAALHESFGRFFYFDPEEVEPLDPEQEQETP